jgi:integrase
MTMGARRGELCALRWQHIDLDNNVITLRRAISVGPDGDLVEKKTKTHQQARTAIDSETARRGYTPSCGWPPGSGVAANASSG